MPRPLPPLKLLTDLRGTPAHKRISRIARLPGHDRYRRQVQAAMAPSGPQAVTGVAATDVLTAATHQLVVGHRVRFSGLTGGAPLAAGTDYYVVWSGANRAFQVSTTPGGSPVNITTDLTAGTVTLQ